MSEAKELTAAEIAGIRQAVDDATPGEWEWWNGCSWWRLGVRGRHETRVIEPTRDSDGHLNLIIRPEDRRYLERTQPQRIALLLATLDASRAREKALVEALESAGDWTDALWGLLRYEFEAAPDTGEVVTADVRPYFNALCEFMTKRHVALLPYSAPTEPEMPGDCHPQEG